MDRENLEGSVIGDTYTILEKLGSGGMGTVYKASDFDGKLAAVKVLRPEMAENEEFIKRFLREIATLSELKHPNIAQYYNADTDGTLFYYAMEYVDGESLMDLVEQGHEFSEDETARIGMEVADVLGYAAKRGIIHRDIKPENIIIVSSTREVKLLDLGFARYTHSALKKVTRGVKAIGTVDYMSPEQAKGLDDIDIRSDIYGLGATMFLLATGSIPYPGEDDMTKMRRIVKEPPPAPGMLNPAVSKELDYIISKMMRHNRNTRYQEPEEVMRDLVLFMEGTLAVEENEFERRGTATIPGRHTSSNKLILEIVIIGWIALIGLMLLYIIYLLVAR